MRCRHSLLVGVVVCSAASMMLALSIEANARSCRISQLPNSSKNSCANCHTSRFGGGARNAFGNAVGAITGGRCISFWSPQLAAMDSDGDGLTNGEELQDPEGTWTVGMRQPGDSTKVLNPGVKDAPTPPVDFIRGDTNADGKINVVDGITILLVLFAGRPHLSCQSAEDADDSGKVELSDAVYILEFLFSGGPAPPFPFPDCGAKPGRLTCKSHAACD